MRLSFKTRDGIPPLVLARLERMDEIRQNVFVDFGKLAKAIRYYARYISKETLKNALESRGFNNAFAYWCEKYANGCDEYGKSPNVWSVQKAIKEFNLRPSSFFYFSDHRRPTQELDPERDFYLDDGEQHKLLEISPVSKKIIEHVKEEHDKTLLGEKLSSFTWAEVDTFERLISFTLLIAELFKKRFPVLSVEHIMHVDPEIEEDKRFIIVRCEIIKDVVLDFKFKLIDPDKSEKYALGCIDVKNNLIDERYLSDSAFSKVDPKTVIDYLTLLKRETTIFRRI